MTELDHRELMCVSQIAAILAAGDGHARYTENLGLDYDEVARQAWKLYRAVAAAKAEPETVTDAAKRVVRAYAWWVRNPGAPIAGGTSLDARMTDLARALGVDPQAESFDAGTEPAGREAKE